jgi:hypothetical protein
MDEVRRLYARTRTWSLLQRAHLLDYYYFYRPLQPSLAFLSQRSQCDPRGIYLSMLCIALSICTDTMYDILCSCDVGWLYI